LIVAAFIAWLKVAVTVVLTATPAAPPAGVTEATVGAMGGVDVPEPDPPHPETTSPAQIRRQTIPERIIRFLLRSPWAERMAYPTRKPRGPDLPVYFKS
jgi:hypothetical protein